MCDRTRRIAVLALAGLTYFVAYPGDAQAIARPVTSFLEITSAISPWLYVVIAVGLIALAVVKTWGPHLKGLEPATTESSHSHSFPPTGSTTLNNP